MSDATPVPEDQDSPYVGSDAFDDMELTAEEQAIMDAELAGEVEAPEAPPAAEPTEEFVKDEAPVEEITPADAEAVAAENPEPEPEVPDGTGDNEVKPEETPAPTPHQIPKARLDREIQKRRELEQQLAELQSVKRVEQAIEDKPIDLSGSVDMEAITKALDMNLDGKNSEAAAIIAEQLQNAVKFGSEATRDQMKELVAASTEAAVNQAVGQVRQQSVATEMETVIAEIEQDYPIFNPDAEGFDQALVDRAQTMRRVLEADGAAPAEALREAVNLTISRHRPDLVKTPAPAPTPAEKTEAKARQRNAAAAEAQPPRQAGQANGKEGTTLDINNLSEEEFDALPDSVLAELRGDQL